MSINAKEIAVTFPLAVGLYELLWAPPSSWRPRAVLLWLTLAPARLSLLSAALLMVYLAGKFLGAESLLANPSYRPQLSLAMYLDTYARYMAQLLYLVVPPSRITMFSILAAALGIAALSRRRELLWAAVFNVISVLPIAFIEARNGFAFYIPATGWTLYVVALLLYASDALTGRLSRVMSAPRASILQASRAVLVVILAVYLLPLHSAMLQHPINFMRAARGYKPYWQQLRDLMPHPRPGGRILILNDPLPADTYEMYFLVRLMFADRSLIVHRVKQTPKTVSSLDPSEYDYVIDFVGDRFVLAESRHRPGKPRLRCRGSGHDRILT